MKPSAYNYIVPNGEKTIFFNGITESFFEISESNAVKYKEIIQNPSIYADSFSSFIEKMKDKGFVIDDGIDEDELLEQKFQETRSDGLYHIMILPTYQCNLRCWYCVQEHQDLSMSRETVDNLKDLLQRKINDPSIKYIKISWFGGEPLLGYDVILEITSFVRHLTSEANKPFICHITTNGTLLNRNRIDALREAGVTDYQITIDGDKKTHDSIKVLPNESAFEKTLENINIIAETTKCILRFNYTHENLKPEAIIENIKSRIKPENRANVTFMVYKVWQEEQDLIDEGDVMRIVGMSEKIGIKPLLPTCNACYADATHFNCIFPNGKVEKCDNESPIAAKGEIVNGEIVWDGDISAHTPAFKNSAFPCRKCRYLPVCWGPCVAKRTLMLRNFGKGRCQYENMEEEMARYIKNRCSNAKQQNNL